MAEYVRRKRPPGSHPHWARLHDLTHPPAFLTTYTGFGIVGMVSGGYCGAQESITFSSAMLQAAECALYLSGFFAIGGFFTCLSDRRSNSIWSNLGMSLLMAGLVFACCFLFTFMGFAAVLLFRWLAGGEGWLLGVLYGLAVAMLAASFSAWNEHRTWRRRQRRWPHWENGYDRQPAPSLPELLPPNPVLPQWTAPPEPVIQPEPPVRGTSTHGA